MKKFKEDYYGQNNSSLEEYDGRSKKSGNSFHGAKSASFKPTSKAVQNEHMESDVESETFVSPVKEVRGLSQGRRAGPPLGS